MIENRADQEQRARVILWGQEALPAFHKMLAGERFSYLRVSTAGIVNRLWPYAEFRADWEQVAGLKRGHRLGDRLN